MEILRVGSREKGEAMKKNEKGYPLRMPLELYDLLKAVSKHTGRSINRLIVENIDRQKLEELLDSPPPVVKGEKGSTYCLRMPAELHEALKEESERMGESMNQIVLTALVGNTYSAEESSGDEPV